MNRIQSRPAPAAREMPQAPFSKQVSLATTLRRGSPFQLFTPLHYEPNYAYPLIVWLHGAGGDETQLTRVMPHVSLRNHAAVGPRATAADRHSSSYRWEQTAAGVRQAEQAIFESIEAAESRLNVAPTRIFIAGYQDGGVMALRIALRHPDRFAGAATICGQFPRGLQPLSRLNEVRRTPLLLMYGQESRAYSTDALCDDLELFHTAGLRVAVRQYPCGDEITTAMLHDLDAWIMEQVTGESLLDCGS